MVEVFADLVQRFAHVFGSEHPETLRVRKMLGIGHPDHIRALNLLIDIEARDERSRSTGTTPSYITHAGGGEGSGGSDRALKCNITPVGWSSAADTGPAPRPQEGDQQTDGFAILRAVASMPVSTWSYRGEEDVRHLCPMAQDWHAALGLGADDRTIRLVDANGVSAVAVQALYRMVRSLEAEVSDLRARLDGRPAP
ncbi:hypothetical protein [Streptomyces coeruleorubidus]|uniref:hypothetical protein n=1 Tax=Streptomyces coeruleorubidus TaxID=116188 RepID=UPI0033FDA234